MFRTLPIALLCAGLLCGMACTPERASSPLAPEPEGRGSTSVEPEGWLIHSPGDLIDFTQTRHAATPGDEGTGNAAGDEGAGDVAGNAAGDDEDATVGAPATAEDGDADAAERPAADLSGRPAADSAGRPPVEAAGLPPAEAAGRPLDRAPGGTDSARTSQIRRFTEEIRELGRVDALRRVLAVSPAGQEEFEHRPGRILRRVGEVWLPLLDRALLAQEEGTERGEEEEGWRVVRRFAHTTPPAGYAGPCATLWWEAEQLAESDAVEPATWARIARIEERWLLCQNVGEVARDIALTTAAGQRSALRRERVAAPER